VQGLIRPTPYTYIHTYIHTVKLLLSGTPRKYHSSVSVCVPLPNNDRYIVAYLTVAAYQRVYMPQYLLTQCVQSIIDLGLDPE
jgi:hypothetical protein